MPRNLGSGGKQGGFRRLRHRGKDLILVDLNSGRREDCERALEAADELAREGSEAKARCLVDMTDACVDPDLTLRWKRAAPEHLLAMEKAAVLGADGLRQIALSGYLMYARLLGLAGVEKVRQFKDKQAALAWLSED